MAGYSARQSVYNTGDTIEAADSNDEFNQILAAFNASTGHAHDGTAGEGPRITVLGPAGELTVDAAKAVLDGTLMIVEQAAAEVDIAGRGQIWVQTATPNLLMFTDDAGTDFQVATLTGTETFTNKTLTSPTINTATIEGGTIGATTPITELTVDNVVINGTTISTDGGTDLNLTPLAGQQIVLDGTIVVDAGVVTGATSITSTTFVGALTGNADTATTATTATGATNIDIDATTSVDTTTYPVLVGANATGNQLPFIDNADLSYNASTATLSVTNISGTLQTAAQTNVTSLGTLTALDVDNININGNTISSTAGVDLNITPLAGQQIVLDGTIVIDAGVVTGVTDFTVDNLNINGNTITANTGALNLTPAGGSAIVLDGTINVDAGVVTGATAITTGTLDATTDVTLNTAGGTDAVITETGIDRNSGSAETFNVQNSGAGAMTLQQDGVAVATVSGTQNLSNKTFTDDTTFNENINFAALDAVLETNANFVDIAIWHPSMDRHYDWINKVGGTVSAHMAVTIEDTGANTEMNVWDLTKTTPTAIQTETWTGAATPVVVDILGGIIAVGSEDGIRLYGWGREGWLADIATYSTTSEPALNSNDVDDLAMGYVEQGGTNPNTGTPYPYIATALNEVSGVLRLDGTDQRHWHRTAGDGTQKVATLGDVIIQVRDTGTAASREVRKSVPVGQIAADGNSQFDALLGRITSDDAGIKFYDTDAAPNDVSAGRNLVAVGASGLNIARVSEMWQYTDTADGMGTVIKHNEYTGWMPERCRGAWLHDNITADRSGHGNSLTHNGGGVTQTAISGSFMKYYTNFDGTNNLTAASNAEWDLISNQGTLAIWFRSAGSAVAESLIGWENAGNTRAFRLRMESSSVIRGIISGATTSINIDTDNTYDDGNWHLAVLTMDGLPNPDEAKLYIDGQLMKENNTTHGSVASGGALPLGIGIDPDGSATPATTLDLALARIASVPMKADEVRYMYETERRMFETNSEVVLQGAAATVQSVAVDQSNGDIYVGQSDSFAKLNGIVFDTERLAAGETWTADNIEAISAANGSMAMVNTAEAFAEAPAIDVRDLMAQIPIDQYDDQIDLSKAKAWGVVGMVSGGPDLLLNGHNIEAVVHDTNGGFSAIFATPFVNDRFVAVGTCMATNATASIVHIRRDGNLTHRYQVRFDVSNDTGASIVDQRVAFAIFGTLENE